MFTHLLCLFTIFNAACWIATHEVMAATDSVTKKVLIIGVDGLRPDQMQQALTPHLDALIDNGSVSYVATNTWTPENEYNGHSAPNWASMLTGVTPTQHAIAANGDGQHLIDDDGDNPEDGVKIETVFGIAKGHDPSIETAVLYA